MDDELARRLESLELDIYDYGDDLGTTGPSGQGDDDEDELNALTFGDDDMAAFGSPGDGAAVGNDFDFAGTTSRFLANDQPPADLRRPAFAPSHQATAPASALWNSDPLLSSQPYRARSSAAASRAPQPLAQPHQQPLRAAPKTLQEIEAELSSQQAAPRSVHQQPGPQRFTLDEIERQMLAAAAPTAQQSSSPPPFSHNGMSAQMPQAPPPPHAMGAHPPAGQQPPPPGPAWLLQQQLHAMQLHQHQHVPGAPPLSFLPPPGPLPQQQHTHLVQDAERRIHEHEELEQRRRRKAAKIASMSKHNNLMSNSNKDFITRIQVSQLATDDPYSEDFYYVVSESIKQSRRVAAGMQGPPRPGAQPPTGPQGERKPTRRENAMTKMAQNIQRLVDNARERPRTNQLSLDGALGKIAIRTRSAPRPLLQVSRPESPRAGVSTPGLLSLISGGATAAIEGSAARGVALSRRSILAITEQLYDVLLELEQLRRERSQVGDPDAAHPLSKTLDDRNEQLTSKLWAELRVMDPLDVSDPHPFASLLSTVKGKRIIPRVFRQLSSEQALTVVTLLFAVFAQLDVVRSAGTYDAALATSGELSSEQRDTVTQTDTFMNSVVPPVMAVVSQVPFKMVVGLLSLLNGRQDIAELARTKPGVALLTMIISRAESLRQATPPPEEADLKQWRAVFDDVFNRILAGVTHLFPLPRYLASLPFGVAPYTRIEVNAFDNEDAAAWQLLAAMAVCAEPQQQQVLVSSVRDQVVDNVKAARDQGTHKDAADRKLRNINTFLNALGLDASMITT